MCGIFGIYGYGKPREIHDHWIQDANTFLKHRGPDDQGIYSDRENFVYLGHRRLSILDVSTLGHQPMETTDGSLCVTYNGEIYNFLEIKEELYARGYSFRSKSDTEVLLYAYQEWGIDCISKFNGMFAFGLWDRTNKKLFLVRDRIGIKPLYYLEDEFGIAFASEIKAFLAIPGVRFSAEDKYIPAFLREGYVTGEETFFRGIRKVPQGTYMEISRGKVVRRKYWHLSFASNGDVGEAEWKDKLDSLLSNSVALRLRSDVPVGVFLSGGLDSTTIVAYLEGKSDIPTKTFSVAYDFGKEYDETAFARMAASRYRTDHHEYFVTPKEFQDFIPKYVWFMDEPVSEAAGISLYYISRLAREYVTVILSGEGSDELFGGYDIYRYMMWMESHRSLPGPVRNAIEAIAGNIVPAGGRGRKYLDLVKLPLESRYRGVGLLTDSAIEGLIPAVTRNGRSDPSEKVWQQVYNESKQWTTLSRMLHADMNTWLVDDILLKADKMTMANSLELRVPFLDYRVVEAAASMPDKMKIRGNQKKYILKSIVGGKVPREIVHRKKMGFPTPIELMFRSHLNRYLKDILLDHRTLARGYFSRAGIERAISDHERGIDRSQLLWRLLVLEEWFRIFVDSKRP